MNHILGFGPVNSSGAIVNVRYGRLDDGRIFPFFTDQQGRRIDENYADQFAFREDAGETIFLARELEHMEQAISETDRPELDGFQLCPMSTGAPAFVKTINWKTATMSGAADFIGSAGHNIPRVSKGMSDDSTPFERFAIGAGYDMDEAAAAQFHGMNLDSSNAIAAARAADEFINTGVLEGYAQKKLKGFFGDKLVPRRKADNVFSDGSNAAILAELNACMDAPHTDTNGVERPNRLAMGLTRWNYINETPWSTSNDTSILEHFARNNQHIIAAGGRDAVIPMYSLDSVNLGTTIGSQSVMVAYNFDPSKVEMNITPLLALQVQQRDLEFWFVWTQKLSGVKWKKPKSAHIRYGI